MSGVEDTADTRVTVTIAGMEMDLDTLTLGGAPAKAVLKLAEACVEYRDILDLLSVSYGPGTGPRVALDRLVQLADAMEVGR